ncbi:hypothetical protein CVT24_007564 [Panaeolus cyanescens]|uniref:non-specific serine/threonine protein kinase n=1 Tax=Panaeolus cyanescens TaxID=181874 RepID=A0A409VR73_9AGAR|nr:hypothetical protein CVT24_007564 [Panaeolus cyanescens]
MTQGCRDVDDASPSSPDSGGPLMLTLASAQDILYDTQASRSATSFMTNPHEVKQCSRRMSTSDLQFIRFLGNGTSGQVFQVKDRVSKVKMALKIIRKHDRCDEYTRKVILKERILFEKLADSPWFVHLWASWHDHDNFYFAMVSFLLITYPDRARFYMAEIIIALTELHSRGIIHRDIKAPNILIDREGHIVLADFGLSKDFEKRPSIAERVYQPFWPYLETDDVHEGLKHRQPHELHFVAFGYRGSDLEMAPEIHLSQPYSFGVDFWSAAVVLFWMVTGRPPFYVMEEEYIDRDSQDVRPLKDRVIEDSLFWAPEDDVDDEIIDFLEQMLQKDPQKRLKIGLEMPNHPYFAGVNWPLMERRMVAAPWIPGTDASHAYEPPSEIFALGEPYDTEDEDPYPEFEYNSEEIRRGLALGDDSESDEEDDLGIFYSDCAEDNALDPIHCPDALPVNDNDIQFAEESGAAYASQEDDISQESSTCLDHSTTGHSFQDDTTEEDLPLQESWDVTLVSPPRSKPCAPGPKQWLYPQDVIKIRMDVNDYLRSLSTSTSSSNIAEGCSTPVKGNGFKFPLEICLTSSPSEPHVALSSAFGRLAEKKATLTIDDSQVSLSKPISTSPGFLTKAKGWITNLWAKGSK